jgi:hypothetical protein
VLVDALLDSGSLAGNFISPTTYQNLGGSTILTVDRPDSSPVCSGLNNACTNVSNIVHKLSISFINENKNNIDFTSSLFSFFANVRILSNTPFDFIIGKETIKGLIYLSYCLVTSLMMTLLWAYKGLPIHYCPGPSYYTALLVVRRTTAAKHHPGPNPVWGAVKDHVGALPTWLCNLS